MMNKLFTILLILMLFSCNKEVSIKVNIKDKVSVEDSVQNKNLYNLTEQEYEDLRKSKGILNKREKVLLKWSDSDKLNWLRSCASIGRDEEKCKCILGQLEIMYPSKQKMDIEMKKNPSGFSQSMISAKKECN